MMYNESDQASEAALRKSNSPLEGFNHILDIREYDVAFLQRVCIDNDIRAGCWYSVSVNEGVTQFSRRTDLIELPDVRILAFDIETTKSPLKFPDASKDCIMMISYMIDGHGFLIVNREIVSQDIADFEYTPKPEFPGKFKIINVANEESVLKEFFAHIRRTKPCVYVTYNGDFFDWPFIDDRAKIYGMYLRHEIGIWKAEDEYKGRFSVHLDAFHWVKRDSYLPQGSQGLKAVTKAKLNYNPVELDPEEMLPLASSNPQLLSSYSVSDAVATFYLYEKYVHSFIFSLCMIIPMGPGDVLRKGSGTLCEQLLMVRAFENKIICPNKKTSQFPSFFKNQLLDSETYIGGHVECLESGVFRDDILYKFNLNTEYLHTLVEDVDETIRFFVENECGKSMDDVQNKEDIRSSILKKLKHLIQNPSFECTPLIYHLDVGAMYPNIILTNRLQPMAIVDKMTCASCDFNVRGKECQRPLNWIWRGKYFPTTRAEFSSIKARVEIQQSFKTDSATITEDEKKAGLIKAVKDYSQKVYKKVYLEHSEERQATVCQRENSFYVDTVRDFRDRRYEYKKLKKVWSKAIDKAPDVIELQKARNMELLYDSLQLAHKCILNSFYGYVMRKGARWYSMEMAGVVTAMGANIIKDARIIVESIGRALELDTDGIWCILPSSFPENFEIKFKDSDNGKPYTLTLSYPCTVMNKMVRQRYTNDQYLDLQADGSYKRRSENSIFFEVDGPYKAMILPAAQEEGKSLKKRYAVFDKGGNLVELKGFEIKRRGELKLIKIFQSQVFPAFLEGKCLKSCYASVGSVANQWLSVLQNQGANIDDDELFDLLSESRVMSQALKEYGESKSTSITAAKRLAEFLGDSMVKDKGLNCTYIISRWPQGNPVSSRAIPTMIFQADPVIMFKYIRKWTGLGNSLGAPEDFDVRDILDWDYYTTRLGSSIQKIITIPAALQMVSNPVPLVQHPDWVSKVYKNLKGNIKQSSIGNFFSASKVQDIEDMGMQTVTTNSSSKKRSIVEDKVDDQQDDKETDDFVTIEEDFHKWHLRQKKYWKTLLLPNDFSRGDSIKGKGKKGKKFKSGALKSSNRPQSFQVVQIAEEFGKPGTFRVWVISEGGSLNFFNTRVPRILYINSLVRMDESKYGKIVKKMLPRGKETLNLHEMEMLEEDFLEARDLVSTLCMDEKVEGVYEANIPPAFRLLLQVGCFVRVKDSTSFIGGNGFISFRDLLPLDSSMSTYLENIPLLTKMFFYARSSTGNSDGRGVIALIHPNESDSNVYQAHLIAVNPFKNTIETPNLPNLLDDVLNELDSTSRNRFANVQVHLTKFEQVRTFSDGFRSITNLLTRIHVLSGNAPSIILSQTSFSKEWLSTELPSMNRLFPIVTLPWDDSDVGFPSLNWIAPILKVILGRFVSLEEWWSESRGLCQQVSLPIGNLSSYDVSISTLDILYARMLKQSNQLLWYSNTEYPDVGGFSEPVNYFEPQEPAHHLSFPGAYRSACFELSIDNLSINSLLVYHILQSLEGAQGVVDILSNENQEIALAALTSDFELEEPFKVLRALAVNLFQEFTLNKKDALGTLLRHFYRWLSSSTSVMYDPRLFQLVQKTMSKVFFRLCSCFKQHGCSLVYSSFSKLIIHTTKPFLENAVSYVKYVVESVLTDELFSYVSIDYDKLWESLLFMDKANYVGIEFVEKSNEELEDNGLSFGGTWNIAEFLPAEAREYFEAVVIEFLSRPYRYQMELLEGTDRMSANWQNIRARVGEFTSEELRTFFTPKLLDIVSWLSSELPGDERAGSEAAEIFPRLPGSYLPLHNPSLEFVKMISHVFSLDDACQDAVSAIRTNMLKMVGVRPFAAEAQFVNPCRSVVIHDMVCSECLDFRDLDLCRDPRLLSGDFSCPSCHSKYDKEFVELYLIKELNRLVAAYQVQDLKCVSCKNVQEDNFSNSCTCGRSFKCEISESFMKTQLASMSNIGEFYDLNYVVDTTRQILLLQTH